MNLNQQSPIRSLSLILLLILLGGSSAMAQGWCLRKSQQGVRVKAHELNKSPDKKLFVTGMADPSVVGNTQVYYGKFNKASGGDVFQNRIAVTIDDDGLSNACQGPNNSMVVVGYAGHRYTHAERVNMSLPLCSNLAKMYVAKVDNATGGIIWQRTLNKGCDDYGYDVVGNSLTGEYAVLGNHYSSNDDVFDIFLVFMNDNGTALREKSIRSTTGKSLYARRILNSPDGGLLILAQEGENKRHPYIKSGFYQDFVGEATLVIRLDAAGDILWSKRISYTNVFPTAKVLATDMLQNPSTGDIFLTGTINFSSAFDYGYVIKLNAVGTWQADIRFKVDHFGPYQTVAQSILRQGNSLFVSGYTFDGSPQNKFLATFSTVDLSMTAINKFDGGGANGSMRHTNTNGTAIYLAGQEVISGSKVDLVKKTIGIAQCCESTPPTTMDGDLCTVEDGSLEATQFVSTDPQTPTAPAIPVTFVTEDLCSSSKTFNSTTGVEEFIPGIYPNPASDLVNIVIRSESDSYRTSTALRIHNAQGQLILSRELQSGNNAFDTSGMESGIYFLEMRSADKVHTEKLIIQH